MNLEEFLGERLTKEQMKGLNANSKIERMEKDKEDNKLTIALPNELVDMINSNTECKRILRSNIVRFIRSLKRDLELESDIVSIDTISYI